MKRKMISLLLGTMVTVGLCACTSDTPSTAKFPTDAELIEAAQNDIDNTIVEDVVTEVVTAKYYDRLPEWDNFTIEDGAIQIDDKIYWNGMTYEEFKNNIETSEENYTIKGYLQCYMDPYEEWDGFDDTKEVEGGTLRYTAYKGDVSCVSITFINRESSPITANGLASNYIDCEGWTEIKKTVRLFDGNLTNWDFEGKTYSEVQDMFSPYVQYITEPAHYVEGSDGIDLDLGNHLCMVRFDDETGFVRGVFIRYDKY